MALFAELAMEVEVGEAALPAGGAVAREEVDVGGPVVEAVEDVRGVDDGRGPRLGLLPEPLQEILTDDDVEAGGDLVEEEDGEGANQAEEELDAAALAVRDPVHAPVQVHPEDVDELVAPLGVGRLQLLHHVADADVRLERAPVAGEGDCAHAPLRVQEGPLQVQLQVPERVHPHHLHRVVRLRQVLPRQHAEQRALPGAVRAEQEAS
mmetsp:Transcript_16750/g.52369  ORF Transcript_16750/g.52369 Transcript_16750/m.52369 type:complete len:208 (+) Transcript_16750:725-1348(+)